jgi:tetratricopeptide (TPR) repeat protein
MAHLAITYQYLGKYTEAEKLEIQVLDARNRILGVEHPDTITAMANLASTYLDLEKYTEAEKLEIQVFNGRCRILGVEHPDTIRAMRDLASTYYKLGKYTEGEKLQIQAQEAQSRVFGEDHSHKTKTTPNIEDAQDTQVFDARSTVPEEEISDSVQLVLNPPVQAVLPDTVINPEKKGMSFGNCFLNLL